MRHLGREKEDWILRARHVLGDGMIVFGGRLLLFLLVRDEIREGGINTGKWGNTEGSRGSRETHESLGSESCSIGSSCVHSGCQMRHREVRTRPDISLLLFSSLCCPVSCKSDVEEDLFQGVYTEWGGPIGRRSVRGCKEMQIQERREGVRSEGKNCRRDLLK